jgi:hypothetical protein
MSQNTRLLSEDINGRTTNALNDGRAFLQNWVQGAADEVVGDANANGTLILAQALGAAQVLHVYNLMLTSKVANRTILVVNSNAAAVGGAEVILMAHFFGPVELTGGNAPLFIIDNSAGAAGAANLVIYAPQTSGGAVGNNAATEYFAASFGGVLD